MGGGGWDVISLSPSTTSSTSTTPSSSKKSQMLATLFGPTASEGVDTGKILTPPSTSTSCPGSGPPKPDKTDTSTVVKKGWGAVKRGVGRASLTLTRDKERRRKQGYAGTSLMMWVASGRAVARPPAAWVRK
ncbi:hypothetical protein HK104_007351 [Borealophlyctis nickersoniae]|nr:hypothetical protein HK104_007351 [Borealophlyctis nickersoniae]